MKDSEAAMEYFIITTLWAIDHMYRYSLGTFEYFFFKAIDKSEKSEDEAKRVQNLILTIRFTIYTWVARGLAERHKIVLMSQLTIKLMSRGDLMAEQWNQEYLNYLLRGTKVDGEDNPIPWLNDANWLSVNALARLEGFSKFPSDLVEASSRFQEWYNHVTPETEKLPLDWANLEREPFKKLLVIRTLRPDRLIQAILRWLRGGLPDGNKYVDGDNALNAVRVLELALEDSSPATPIFFILSPGADVVSIVEEVAAKRDFEKGVNYHNVAMGEGQDVVAMSALQMGHQQGHWVILNNCHLMLRWCLELEKKLDTFALEGSHERFRSCDGVLHYYDSVGN
jgi:dynein heavy chain